MTPQQEEFIIENRLTLPIKEIKNQLNLSFAIIRKFLSDNNLNLTPAQVKQIRNKRDYNKKTENKVEEIKPVLQKDFWNQNINPITMLRN
jgi:Trm5-related predicted tRNA methylase